jgi:magnesium-transporting ATPase (P-type)
MLTHKYYYDDPKFNNKKYTTLWKGHISYFGGPIPISEDYYQYSNRDLDDLIAETCNINMYCNLQNNTIYLSSDCDFNFYYYDFEKEFHLLGAAVQEDKLQENVPSTIRDLRLANIKFWMLTGDKIETAKNEA